MDNDKNTRDPGTDVILSPGGDPGQSGEPGPGRARRFTWRTVVFPLLFLALHLLFSTIISVIYIFGYIFYQAITGAADLNAMLADPLALSGIIVSHYPVITSLLSAALIPVCLVFLRLSAKRDSRSWMTGKPRLPDLLSSLAMMVGAIGVVNIYFNLLVRLGESSPLIKRLLDDYEATAGAFTPDLGLRGAGQHLCQGKAV